MTPSWVTPYMYEGDIEGSRYARVVQDEPVVAFRFPFSNPQEQKQRRGRLGIRLRGLWV